MGGGYVLARDCGEFLFSNTKRAAFAHGLTNQSQFVDFLSGYGLSFLGDSHISRKAGIGLAFERVGFIQRYTLGWIYPWTNSYITHPGPGLVLFHS